MTFRVGWARRSAVAFAAFALALVATLVAVEAPRPAGAAPPSATVSPATGLADRQRVLVRGTGFPAGPIDVRECVTAQATTCMLDGAAGGVAAPASFAVVMRPRRMIGSTDCATAPGTCEITVQAVVNGQPTTVASTPLSFDPSQPAIGPRRATISPGSGLRDLQTVTVTAGGFVPGTFVNASECTASGFPLPGEQCGVAGLGTTSFVPLADANGTIAVPVVVRRNPPFGNPIDCATEGCTLRISSQSDGSDFAEAALSFAPNPPPLNPQVHASPATNLGALPVVAVSGSGFLPGAVIRLMECPAGQPIAQWGDNCAGIPRVTVTTDGTGAFSSHITPRRTLKPFVGSTILDCAVAGKCALTALGVDDQTTAGTPITFDPNAPPPPAATFSVTPTQNLGPFPVVKVSGAHFAAGDLVGVGVRDASGRIRRPVSAPVAPDGTFSRSVTLGRNVQDKANRVLPDADCATEAFGCLLSVGDSEGRGGIVPVSFDLHAAPLSPVVALAPITTPGDEHAALALVTGAPPDTDLFLQECESGNGGRCDIGGGAVNVHTDATGRGAGLMPVFTSMMTPNGVTRCDLSPGACVVHLGDDDGDVFNVQTPIPFGAPKIVPGIGTVNEPVNGTTTLNVPVTLSALSLTPVTVSYATADVTATAGLDYTATSGTLTFAPLQTTATIPITVNSDTLDEPDEVVRVGLSNPSGATLGGFSGLGFGVIVDANPPPVIVPGTATTPEGGPGTHVVNVPVTLSTASGKTVTASWHTLDGSAVAGTDYQAASGTLTFAPGQTSKTVPVTIIGDAVHDPTKAMFVGITNPLNATIGGFYGLGAVTITDP